MSAKWRKDSDPQFILRRLDKTRARDEDSVSFCGITSPRDISLLKSIIEIDDDISTEIAQELIVKGFFKAAKKEYLTTKNVISSVNHVLKEYLKKPAQPYWLLTTLNINNNNNLPRYRINGCSLCFYNNLPKKYKKARQNALSDVSSWLIDKDERFSYYVIAHISDKSEYDAATKMLDAIDLLRGIWNLNIGVHMVFSFSGRRKPVNKIILGALHTLHNKNGEQANSMFWYQPEHYKNHSKVNISLDSYKTLELTKKVRKLLKKNTYGKDLEIAIIRYVRALDSQDYNTILVKLWSILEYLTYTLKDKYDKTIKRTLFHYSETEYNKQVLECLRYCRNKFVHLDTHENDIEIRVYQLKSYVEKLLKFHISNHFKFENLHDAAKFMDLQPDKEALKKQIALCQAGIKFL